MEALKKIIESLTKDKKWLALCICALLVLAILIVVICVSCGHNEDPTESTGGSTDGSTGGSTLSAEAEYSVTVTDALGTPCNGVIVNFMQGGQLAAMQTLDENGIAQKVLPRGEYTVELGFTDDGAAYHYDAAALTLTAEKTELQIVLSQALGEVSRTISAYSNATGSYQEYATYAIGTGCTYAALNTADRNYFLFAPTESGVYEFRIVGDGEIGYYGSTFFVQNTSIGEPVEDGAFTVSISNSMIGSAGGDSIVLVLGVDSSNTDCIISIRRIGDPQMTIEDYPWVVYEASTAPKAYTLPEGMKLVNFDLTAATDTYTLVLNEEDGFYHLESADGALVFCRLGVDSEYLDSIKTILESSAFACYFYDENGEFDHKESYNNCLQQYVACMDEVSGVYPLTADLMYMIQRRGEFVGWWDASSGSYIFVDENGNSVVGLNPEIAWLFLCCYGEIEDAPVITPDPGGDDDDPVVTPDPGGDDDDPVVTPDPGEDEVIFDPVIGIPVNKDEPIELGGAGALAFTAEVNGGEYLYYMLYKISGTTLRIESDRAYVIYNGVTYWPEDGVVTVALTSESPSVPVQLCIGNFSNKAASFAVTLSYPLGTMSNPEPLSLGTFTTYCAEGNDQGYYYTYTATVSGTLTLTFDSISTNIGWMITVYNLTTYEYLTGTDGPVSVTVNAGDEVQIIIGVYDSSYKYPEATITATATLN